ncbi:hypothetical protein [Collinsella sp. An7]|uniref:hypothetical protein n=1 Tax=Collinsella sp. An7 TaxID=1965651 RepID=UPI00117D5937|nr:hypothetical protein [Collinsella sp. An7]
MMRTSRRAKLIAVAAGVALLLGGGTAYADSIEPFAITPQWTTRSINIGRVGTSWAGDGTKSLTSSSYGQATVTRASGVSASNALQVSARNSSGDLQYPSRITASGQTVTYIRNTFGGTITFTPSMRASSGTISNIGGTWRYYEMP